MSGFIRTALYLLSFSFARGTLFVSPIVLANFLPGGAYGMIEWALAAGTLAATIATLGTASAVPLVALNRANQGSQGGIYLHHMVLALICVMLVVGMRYLNYSAAIQTATLLTVAIALQSLWSIQLKTHAKGEASLVLDAALFSTMAVIAVCAHVFHADDSLNWVFWSVAAYVFCLVCVTMLSLLRHVGKRETLAYRQTIWLGLPLMTGAMVAMAATTSGRLIIGYVGGVLLTADYAILARAAALPIVAHQVILVAKFRQLYELPNIEMEKIIFTILSLVVLSVVGLWILIPYFGWLLGPAFVHAFKSNRLVAIIILAQSVLWSGISLNDTVNTRQQTMLKVSTMSFLLLLFAIPCAIFLTQYIGVTLLHFVYIHSIVMLLFYLAQIMAMYSVGIRLWRSWGFAVFSYLSLIGLAGFLHH